MGRPKIEEDLVRFFRKFKINSISGCWEWLAGIDNDGYGRFFVGTNNVPAHRYIFDQVRGVPNDLVVDHLCRNRGCVNPGHLEAVTNKENIRRGINVTKTSCKHGHAYTAENTFINHSGARCCRKCILARSILKKERTLA